MVMMKRLDKELRSFYKKVIAGKKIQYKYKDI